MMLGQCDLYIITALGSRDGCRRRTPFIFTQVTVRGCWFCANLEHFFRVSVSNCNMVTNLAYREPTHPQINHSSTHAVFSIKVFKFFLV